MVWINTDFNDSFVKKQADHITKLTDENQRLQAENARLHDAQVRDHPAAVFYMEMQKRILENVFLQGEWSRFLMSLKMTDPEYPGANVDGDSC